MIVVGQTRAYQHTDIVYEMYERGIVIYGRKKETKKCVTNALMHLRRFKLNRSVADAHAEFP